MATKRTSATYEAMLVESARQTLAIARGELEAARITERDATVDAPPAFGAKRVQRARAKLGFSQVVFARALNVSPATVRAWEQGGREPDGAAVRLLEISYDHPEVLLAKVRRVSESPAQFNAGARSKVARKRK